MAKQSGPTEAQRIVDELIDLGMQGAAIAREIGVKSDTVHNIKRRAATGNLQLHRLRILREQMSATATPGNAAQSADVPAMPVVDQLPSVADLFSPVQEGPEPAGLTLNGEDAPTDAPKTVKDRAGDFLRNVMFGDAPVTGSAPKRSKKAEGGEQAELVEQIVPLAALLFVMSGQVLIPDPYKPVGPNHDEASAIVLPLVKRAVRELDARKRISEGTMDAIAVLLACSAYGVRAHQTYQVIHAQEVERARSTQPTADAVAVAASVPGNPAPTAGHADSSGGRADGRHPLTFGRRAGHAGPPARTAGRSEGANGRSPAVRQADASIEQLLAADASGRQRLGL